MPGRFFLSSLPWSRSKNHNTRMTAIATTTTRRSCVVAMPFSGFPVSEIHGCQMPMSGKVKRISGVTAGHGWPIGDGRLSVE